MLKKIEYFLPTLKQCWVIVFFTIIVGMFFGGIILYPLEKIFKPNIGRELLPLISYLLPIIPPLIYIYISGKNIQENNPVAVPEVLDKGNFGKANIFLFALFSILATMTVGIITDPLTSLIQMPDSIRKIFEELMQFSVISIITTVIAAPVVEELLLRGVMARGMFFHTTPVRAILWSAFFFAFIHLNPWQAIPAFIIGIFLGWIYWRTHSLKACIFIHFANNGLAMLFATLFPDIKVDASAMELLSGYGENAFLIAYIISIIMLAGILYYFNKNLPEAGSAWQDKNTIISIENE